LFKPSRVKILGFELAGVVEEVGSQVKTFKKGDAIFASCGFKFGAYAEYTCLKESNIMALKPANVSFEEAACVPIGGLTALRLLKRAGVKDRDSVLIYGASGSVGTFAIQVAKHFGATVTAVCSTHNLDLVKELGAHHVVDYTREDFTKLSMQFDVILDAVGKTSKSACKNLLKSSGKYATVASTPKSNDDDMMVLKKLMAEGKLRSVIDRRYTLEHIREAHAYVEGFHKKGNVVVNILPT
jgi:NADPH:quinone reductase-like Zn-dependent oxidoreductase